MALNTITPLNPKGSKFEVYVECIYPIEREIQDTADTTRYAPYFNLHLELDSEDRIRKKSYDKGDHLNFLICSINFSVDAISQKLWFL